ncbi:translation initiation factor IF-3 [Akkermansiaceae bacterium]|nr:translation initiation factor IF-3 [Akkermansiaceae bacterium]MDB4500873.1 translation initiation factor IF-3 [Akkermansiaceae bacterium]
MTRVNEKIRAPKIRVVYEEHQLGVMTPQIALVKAKSVGLDLVEIAAKADPPVCRIVDYGKYKYEQSKLKKTSKSKGPVKMKEVKFRVRTEEHDYNIKCARAEQFLDEGNKVRVQLQFRGRENAHRDIGFIVMNRVKEDLAGISHCDMEPKLAGRAIGMILAPIPEEKRVRKFMLSHGELIHEDEAKDEEFEDSDDIEGEDNDGAAEEGGDAEVTDAEQTDDSEE